MARRLIRARWLPGEEYYEDDRERGFDAYLERLADVRQHPSMQASLLLADTAGEALSGYAVYLDETDETEKAFMGLIVRLNRLGARQVPVRFWYADDEPPQVIEVCAAMPWLAVGTEGPVLEREPLLRYAVCRLNMGGN